MTAIASLPEGQNRDARPRRIPRRSGSTSLSQVSGSEPRIADASPSNPSVRSARRVGQCDVAPRPPRDSEFARRHRRRRVGSGDDGVVGPVSGGHLDAAASLRPSARA